MEQPKQGGSCEYGPWCKCRVCLTAKAVLLLALGAGLGFFAGRHCELCRAQHAAPIAAPQTK